MNYEISICPQIQQKWLKKNFGLTQKDMPEMFYANDMIDQLLGKGIIRLDDYKGDSQDFIDDCTLSFTCSNRDEIKYWKVVDRLKYLMLKCERLEFYELSSNLKVVISYMQRAVDQYNAYNLDYVQDQVKSLFAEIGIPKEDTDLLF